MKKLKITAEQYNRLIKPNLITEKVNDNKPVGDMDEMKKEVKQLLAYLYHKPVEFSPFWEKHGLSYDDICDALLSKKLIVKKGGEYQVSSALGGPEEALNAVETELRRLAKIPEPSTSKVELETEDYPAGAEHDPSAPYNQPDPEPIYNESDYGLVVYNSEVAILKDKYEKNKFYVLDLVEYFDGHVENDEDIYEFLNSKGSDIEKMLIPLDMDLINQFDELYDLNQFFIGQLAKIKQAMTMISEEDDHLEYQKNQPKKYTSDEAKKALASIKARHDKENGRHPIMKTKNPLDTHPDDVKPNTKHPLDPHPDDAVDETTCAGSSGAFVGPLMGGPKASYPIKKETPTVSETTTADAGNFQYDANALPGINRDGSFKKPRKTKAQTTTQYPNGTMVGGGKTGGSVISPSLGENVIKKKSNWSITALSLNETLKLQHNKDENKLIVISDLEGRAGSQETFHNKAVLKQNGFMWSGTNWVIDSDKLDIAKKTLSLINKSDYIIDQLEELDVAVQSSTADNKELLKARIDQYIMDLANATDEVALSAEIRRYLTFFSKFHSYSFYNRMLIFIQKPEATKVGSFKLWETKFRRVKKGAKAIKVLAPAGKPETTQYDDETTELMGQMGITNRPQITRFRAVNVFDISDTEPIDERGETPDSPQWWGENTPSETADILFGAVSEVATDLGIRVTQSDANGGEKGYSAGDHINISTGVSGAARLSTTIHEIAHELMHWKKSSLYFIDNGEGRQKNELQELQAESVSYVVLKHYGIPVAHHATYLVLWKANKERIQNNLEIISKVSQFIIDKIDAKVSSVEK